MDTIKQFKAFVDELGKENGRNYKISVIEKYKDDEVVRFYLHFLFNPYIVTGISDKKLNRVISVAPNKVEAKDERDIFNYVAVNNTGRDSTIATIQQFRDENVEDVEIFNRLITKDLPLGIDVKTINKVIPGLIPEFNVQLAEKYFDRPEKVEGKDFSLTTKIDGGRIIAIKENGKISFYTRQGQPYEGLVDLEHEMQFMPDNICLDGEITLLDTEGLTSKDQYKKTMKITRALGNKHGVKMLVFDYMPAEDFRNQKCKLTYKERREKLNEIFLINYKYFNLLPILYTGTDTTEIVKWLNHNISKGEEGVMININDAKYEFRRTWNLIKVKKMQTLDLQIIGFEEGTNKLTNNLGAILVRYRDGNIVKVGSGFSDELRKEIWNNKETWLNRICEIQYFEETSNDNGGLSLRFPVYIDYRTDKVEADF